MVIEKAWIPGMMNVLLVDKASSVMEAKRKMEFSPRQAATIFIVCCMIHNILQRNGEEEDSDFIAEYTDKSGRNFFSIGKLTNSYASFGDGFATFSLFF